MGLVRIDKELSISNSINIGEVSGGWYTGGVVGWLENFVDSAAIKRYSHNTGFNIVGCSNEGDIAASNVSGGVVGCIDNRLSYAGIVSKATADTFRNETTVKHCFNAGSVSSQNVDIAGVISHIFNYTGKSGDTTRGGKVNVDISYNYNIGSINGKTVGGISSYFCNHVYGNNCYYNATFSNNFNTGILNGGASSRTGGLIAYFRTIDESTNKTSQNLKIDVFNCYNYLAAITTGTLNSKGGIVGWFGADANYNYSRATLSNCYSAFDTLTGSTNGANVGE